MFTDINLNNERPASIQIKDYIKEMILNGIFQKDVKLPSTRELSELLNISRNTVITAYQFLEDEGFIYAVKGRGVFVSDINISYQEQWNVDWNSRLNDYVEMADSLDTIKNGIRYTKDMISFQSIAPDEGLFDLEEFKRAFLNRLNVEGEKLLNYGYAKGYKPLIEYLLKYMKNKGVDTECKDIMITNGFTEGFDIILSSLTSPGDRVICENPTHNTAIKIMKLHGLEIEGISIEDDGLNLNELKNRASKIVAKLAYLIPSYHNPTGIVMSPEKRIEAYKILRQYEIPVVEDGFNEELRYSGSHVAPLVALSGRGNSVIYIGSFSKVLFPGIRIGWILGDQNLIYSMESVKRSRNIHTSVLDQGVLYQYLMEGNFEKYIKKARKTYKEKYELALSCAKENIPCRKIWGEGGLHIFIELDGINSRELLKECYKKGVVFTPGDIFYTNNAGKNTMRIGFSRLDNQSIEKGIKVIGEVIKNWRF